MAFIPLRASSERGAGSSGPCAGWVMGRLLFITGVRQYFVIEILPSSSSEGSHHMPISVSQERFNNHVHQNLAAHGNCTHIILAHWWDLVRSASQITIITASHLVPMIRVAPKERVFFCANLCHVMFCPGFRSPRPLLAFAPYCVHTQTLTTTSLPRQMGNRLESYSQVLYLLSPSLSFARTSRHSPLSTQEEVWQM